MPAAAQNDATYHGPTPPRQSYQVAVADRVLAEALRIAHEQRPLPRDDRITIAAVINECPDYTFEQRIVERARRLPEASSVREVIHSSVTALRWAVVAAAVLALVSGGLAAQAALRERTASIPALVFGLLGVQTLLLVAWLLLLLGGRRLGAGGGALGSAVVGMGRFFARMLAPAESRRASMAAIAAITLVHASGKAGRWTLSAISHGLWALFNIGALVVLAALFLGEGYQFRWDSTWLSHDSYGSLISALANGPRALGFEVPDLAQIESSRSPSAAAAAPLQDAAAREAWSWFFFGSVVTYGLLPRLVLLAISIALRRLALRRYRLNVDRPGFAMLRARLAPESQAIAAGQREELAGARTPGVAAPGQSFPRPHARAPGSPMIVGVEMSPPATGWPPRFGVSIADLGIIDGHEDEQRILNHVAHAQLSPNPLIVITPLQRSPDRGIERLLADLHHAASSSTRLLLTGGRDMARQHDAAAIERRARDWRELALRAGINDSHVLEVDLDHLTDQARARMVEIILEKVVDPEELNHHSQRRIDEALHAIESHVSQWSSAPDPALRATLLSAVSGVYGHESDRWGRPFVNDFISRLGGDGATATDRLVPTLRSAADSVRRLLPPSLAANSKWLAAGGLAGALGCIAVASTVAPVVLTALPMWSLFGAAMTAAGLGAASARGSRHEQPAIEPDDDAADAIRAAVLFALILELQGRSEASISRILELTLASLPDLDAHNLESLAGWLDEVRHRYDLALIEEQRQTSRA